MAFGFTTLVNAVPLQNINCRLPAATGKGSPAEVFILTIKPPVVSLLTMYTLLTLGATTLQFAVGAPVNTNTAFLD
jgi:hypothetical protein